MTFSASVLLVPAATTIFGVGGQTIVATKMSRWMAGLKTLRRLMAVVAAALGRGFRSRCGEGRRSLESVSYFAPPALVLATIFQDKIIEMPTPGYFGNVSLENHSGMQRFREGEGEDSCI